jgi:hypothetical protein
MARLQEDFFDYFPDMLAHAREWVDREAAMAPEH